MHAKVIVIDTETTGTNISSDYVLSLSIIDDRGNILFNEMFKPGNLESWFEASKINGIYYDDVKNKPLISKYKNQIEEILNNAEVIIGYNHIKFDLPILQQNGISLNLKKNVKLEDVMIIVASIISNWSSEFQDYKWVKLEDAYSHFIKKRYRTKHNSLEDAKATLEIYNAVNVIGVDQERFLDIMRFFPFWDSGSDRSQMLAEDIANVFCNKFTLQLCEAIKEKIITIDQADNICKKIEICFGGTNRSPRWWIGKAGKVNYKYNSIALSLLKMILTYNDETKCYDKYAYEDEIELVKLIRKKFKC